MTASGRAARVVRGTWHVPAPMHYDVRRAGLMSCGVRLRDDRRWEEKLVEDFDADDVIDRCRNCFPEARSS